MHKLLSTLGEKRSYANVAGSNAALGHLYDQFGARNFRVPPAEQFSGANSWSRGTGGPERRRRNVVQLRWEGAGQCPSRGQVMDMILSLGIKVAEIFAVIHPMGSRDFDVSFMNVVIMELFIISFGLISGTEIGKVFLSFL